MMLLPFAAALVIGSVVGLSTASWGRAFILWQLFLWGSVSLTIIPATRRIAAIFKPIFSDEISDKQVAVLLSITPFISYAGTLALLAGLAISIWVMVVGGAANASMVSYWPLPFAAFLYCLHDKAGPQLRRIRDERRREQAESDRARLELERRQRCTNLMPAQRDAYESKFLLTLHSLLQKRRSRWVLLSEIRSGLQHECEPELLPRAMQKWIDRDCISVETRKDGDFVIALLEGGRQVCIRIESTGLAFALRDHDRCLNLSEAERDAFRGELLRRINAETNGGSRGILLDSVRLEHPCALELMSTELGALSDLGLVFLKEITREVYLMKKGVDLIEIMKGYATMEDALSRYDQRHKRCLEATDLQRTEFENQFLLALYRTTSGDTGSVKLRAVWKRLNHECFREMTLHALKVWYERKCIDLDSRIEGHADLILRERFVYDGTELSLTAKGRDLCKHAIVAGSMQQALSESMEGYRVKHEYHVHNSQVGAVGPDADVHDNEFAQFINTFSRYQLDILAQELAELREELLRRESSAKPPSAEHYAAIGAVSEAELAARDEDQQRVWQHLARVGRWVLDTANEIGKSLAVEAIKAVFKAYNIRI